MADPQAPSEMLDRILARSQADSFELPPLVISRDDGPSWIERLWKWFSDLFPKHPQSSSNSEWLGILLKTVAIVGGIMIIVAIVSITFSYLRKRARQAGFAAFSPQSGSGSGTALDGIRKRMEDALSAGRLDEAARLRWKLHLRRRELPASITPGETEGFGRFYPLMFGMSSGSVAQSEFSDLDKKLVAIE